MNILKKIKKNSFKVLTILLYFVSFIPFAMCAEEFVFIEGEGILQENVKALENDVSNLKYLVHEQAKNIEKIDELKKVIRDINSRVDIQSKAVEYGIYGAANQIASVNTVLAVFGGLFAIFGLLLGIYITYIAKNVANISKGNTKELEEVRSINELIHKDISGLYNKIKKEETEHILKRLIEVPEDIGNLFTSLASRTLYEDDYSKLKKAFMRLGQKDRRTANYREAFELLFLQHFFSRAIEDIDINTGLFELFPRSLKDGAMFKSDILFITSGFIRHIIISGLVNSEKNINWFLDSISESEIDCMEDVFSTIYNTLSNKNDRFTFYSLIESSENAKLCIGKLIEENYKKAELTEEQVNLFDRISGTLLQAKEK